MDVRELVEADLEEVLDLYEGLAGPWPLPKGEFAKSRWNEILAHPGTHVFGVINSKKIIGIATLHILPSMTFSGAPYALVENVVVSQSDRGKGVGSFLMNHLIDFAADKSAYKIMLLTGKSNGAKAFYESVGFSEDEKYGMTIRFAPKRFGNMN